MNIKDCVSQLRTEASDRVRRMHFEIKTFVLQATVERPNVIYALQKALDYASQATALTVAADDLESQITE